MSKNPIVHFEMPYKDGKRASEFYQKAFGWKMTQLGSEMEDYIMAETAETNENQMVKIPGAINGGFFPLQEDGPTAPSVVVAVEDIKEAMDNVVGAGGEVLGEPVEIPGVGQYVSFKDPEGNRVSLLQSKG